MRSFPAQGLLFEYLPNKPGIDLTRVKKNVLQAISVVVYFDQQIHAVQGSLLSKSKVCNIRLFKETRQDKIEHFVYRASDTMQYYIYETNIK